MKLYVDDRRQPSEDYTEDYVLASSLSDFGARVFLN
jgi:hypothetical protein